VQIMVVAHESQPSAGNAHVNVVSNLSVMKEDRNIKFFNKTGKCTNNVILRCVRIAIVAVEKQ
jgi:hypothetical protein